jgi:hypothetical protein
MARLESRLFSAVLPMIVEFRSGFALFREMDRFLFERRPNRIFIMKNGNPERASGRTKKPPVRRNYAQGP